MRDRIATTVLILIAIAVGAFFYKRYHIPPPVDIPSMAVTDLRGQPVSLQAYSGKPIFVSFFATWCGPCMRELPDLAALHDMMRDKEMVIMCISDDPIEKLQVLQSEYGDKLIFLHAAHLHDIGIYTYPTNYIFNASGRKVYSQVNAEKWDDPGMAERVTVLLDK
ncbi:MAG: TlpA family protein disulfide reductase [Bacteroidetes bacterium]|nr:TlpA family protein disulfide reductase [Bacteroidota bacterium]